MKLRLENLTPADVARAGRGLRSGFGLALGDWLRVLTTYAQRNEAGDANVCLYLDEAMRALFAPPGQLDYDPLHAKLATPDPIAAPDAAKVVIVLRAARARIRLLGNGEHGVDAPDLAALAGIDESYVRRLARGGVLARLSSPRGPITAASARVFLEKRGVVPFGKDRP